MIDSDNNHIADTCRPSPIIVIGAERSGTKWLSNILCNHSEVIGAQSEVHGGIIETNMLTQMEHKFDLNFEDDYVGLLELWSKTDFFRATRLDKRFFCELQDRPTNCLELFRALMDEFARKNKKRFWLQKTSAQVGQGNIRTYENVRFVIIARDTVDCLKSTIQNQRNSGSPMTLLNATYSHVFHEKRLKPFRRHSKAIEVSYEDLLRDPPREILRICQHIGIDYETAMLRVGFKKNTSFRNRSDRHSIIQDYEKVLIKVYVTIFRLLPLPFFYCMMRIKRLFTAVRADPFVRGTFSLLREEYIQQKKPSHSEACETTEQLGSTLKETRMQKITNFDE